MKKNKQYDSWTKSPERTDKTVASLFLQNLADVAHATDGELIIVKLVSRCSSCIHYIIALLLFVLAFGFSWGALGSRVMLGVRRGKKNLRLKKKKKGMKCRSLLNSLSLCINVAHLRNSPGSQSCVLLHVQKWYGRLLEVRGRHSSVQWLYQCWETSFFHLSTACFFHRCLRSSLEMTSRRWNLPNHSHERHEAFCTLKRKNLIKVMTFFSIKCPHGLMPYLKT